MGNVFEESCNNTTPVNINRKNSQTIIHVIKLKYEQERAFGQASFSFDPQ